MSKAVFTTSESSAYDDQPEVKYHFPKTYLGQVEQAVGDWILYYEPRRTSGPSSSTGRQSYFAMARVDHIARDPTLADHYYAYLDSYIELDHAVPFRDGNHYYESALSKADGSTNKGSFGRSVRPIHDDEFSAIVNAGFTRMLDNWEAQAAIAEQPPEYVVRPLVEQIVTRKFRDDAFRRHVRTAYSNTCAVSGLNLINGGGRPEVQAAHIRSVAHNGPDTVRNGIALTGTVHWLFDRGLISVDDTLEILVSPHGMPDDLLRLVRPERRLIVPTRSELRPHPTYLRWHRDNIFKR